MMLPAGVLLLVLSFALQPVYGQEMTVARYSMLSTGASAEERDPLSALVDEAVPESVETVGEAVRFRLTGSGYRLSDAASAPKDREALLALPLPDVHREVGLISLRTALQVLASPGFVLVEDPVHRLISFEPCRPEPLEPSGE